MPRSIPPPPGARRPRTAAGASLALAALLAACAAAGDPPTADPAAAALAPQGPESIAFDLPDFDPAATRRALNRDPRSGNEVHYAAFSGADSFAAVVLVRAGRGYTLEPQDATRHLARMLPATPVSWGEGGSVQADNGRGADYRLFDLPEVSFRCFAFDERWAPALDDDGGRWFTRQAFGFYCRAADQALGEADIRRLIPRISFAGGRTSGPSDRSAG